MHVTTLVGSAVHGLVAFVLLYEETLVPVSSNVSCRYNSHRPIQSCYCSLLLPFLLLLLIVYQGT